MRFPRFAHGVLLLTILGVTGGAAPCWAISLREDLQPMADSIGDFLKKRGEAAVSIGQFSAPPQFATSGGNGISQFLLDGLPKLGIAIQRRAKYGLKGDFKTEKSQFGGTVARIDVEVVDSNGEVAVVLTHNLFDEQSIAELMGLTIDLSPQPNPGPNPNPGPDDAAPNPLDIAIDHPTATITGNTVRSKAGSPYGLEICKLVNGEYVTLTPVDDEGLAFVKLQRDDVYAVRLVNNSGFDAAVSLTIDGINLFTFSETPQYRHMIVTGPTQVGLIKGWHRTNQIADSFQVMEYSKSAVAKVLPDSTSVGTITATYCAAWMQGANPPPGEPIRYMMQAPGPSDATGRGQEVRQNLQQVKRETGVVRSIVTVRYTK
jgi:hypothetical protein